MNIVLHGWRESVYRFLTEDIAVHFSNFVSSLTQYLIDTVEHLILACIIYIVLCISLYICIVKKKYITFNRNMRHAKRILFIIAHPDDECMFFGPTILNYTRKENCAVYLMCLTNGNNYGMGQTRKRELYKSCEVLGIPGQNIIVHSHTHLPDAMHVRWPTELVAKLVSYHVDALNITTIITFDRYGVSRHCNHTCIYYGIANLIIDEQLPKCCGVYVLETINTLRKYWLFLDIPLALFLSRFRYMNDFKDRQIIHKAMSQHESQLVWFRRLYMYFSRYMLINTLQQMNLVDIELDLVIND